jgi:hypothetical protein
MSYVTTTPEGTSGHFAFVNLIPQADTCIREPKSTMSDSLYDETYRHDSDDHMRGQVEIRQAVHDELDDFWKRLATRLDTIGDHGGELTREAIAEVKADLKTAIAENFGKPVARTLRSVMRGSSNWNDFCKDEYEQHRAHAQTNELPGNTIQVYALILVTPYAEFVKNTCSQRWQALDEETKKNYRSLSLPTPRLSNVIGSDEQSKKRGTKRLIDNIKNAVWWFLH